MTKSEWEKIANKFLKGKKIVRCHYMTKSECETMGWDRAGLVLELSDTAMVMFSADDEGNGPGACFTTYSDLPILPVI